MSTDGQTNHLNHQPFISVWAACPSIPSRLRGVRAVRANATATTNSRVEEGMWTWCNGGCWHCWDAQAVRQIAGREMRRVGAAYRTISRLDDRLIENAEDVWAGVGQDYYYRAASDGRTGCICWTQRVYLWLFLRIRHSGRPVCPTERRLAQDHSWVIRRT